MRIAALIVVSICFSFGCGKSDAKAKNNAAPSPMVTKLASLADKGCACKGYACTKAVYAEVAAFAKTIKTVADADKNPMQASQAKLDECTATHNPFIKSYKQLTARVCACSSKRCVKKTLPAFNSWIAKVKRTKGAIQKGHLPTFMGYGKTAASCFKKYKVAIPN